MKGRKYYGDREYKPMSAEDIEKMKQAASCYMVVQFHNNPKPFSIWSRESQDPKIHNISDAINKMFWIFNRPQWKGTVASAAIFDVRRIKKPTAENKIYQWEKGVWRLINQPIW